VFSYSDEEEDGEQSSTTTGSAAASAPSKVQYTKYTDLEELD